MLFNNVTAAHWLRLAALLRRADLCVPAGAEHDRPFIEGLKAGHPGLDRTHEALELVAGQDVADRWIHLVVLRGLQIFVTAQGNEVLLLGGIEAPFVAVHKDFQPLAVRGIPPNDTLFVPSMSEDERCKLGNEINDAATASLRALREVAKEAPLPGDVLAEQVWGLCRARAFRVGTARTDEEQRRRDQILADWSSRTWIEQFEMVLALSERVLAGRDKPGDRQLYAGTAHMMWSKLTIRWNEIDVVATTRKGWVRVAGLASQDAILRDEQALRLRDAMALICQDEPVDIKVNTGTTVKVYRFHQGHRQLIDRRGGRKGRVH